MQKKERKTVCILGLGFVGSAMSIAVSSSRDNSGNANFNVIGIDKESPIGLKRIQQLNAGIFPFKSQDKILKKQLKIAIKDKVFYATSDINKVADADFIIVDINLDISLCDDGYITSIESFLNAINQIGKRMKSSSLLIVETTVPPGTTELLIKPALINIFKQRGIKSQPLIAHSYERVMPGPNYFNSIINYPRVFSATTPKAKKISSNFLSKVIHGDLSYVNSTTASEMAKVLENSYRAMNIAFIEEWTQLAEYSNVNLYEILGEIRKRGSHSNIMSPGLGVGGYCLTKDSYLADWSAKELFNAKSLTTSLNALDINKNMPKNIYKRIKPKIKDAGKKVLILGLSYLPNIGDDRSTPVEDLYELMASDGFEIEVIDEYMDEWDSKSIVINKRPSLKHYDTVILATAHSKYLTPSFRKFIITLNPNLVIDCWGKYSSKYFKNMEFLQIGNGELN